jgi:hypothetical protein
MKAIQTILDNMASTNDDLSYVAEGYAMPNDGYTIAIITKQEHERMTALRGGVRPDWDAWGEFWLHRAEDENEWFVEVWGEDSGNFNTPPDQTTWELTDGNGRVKYWQTPTDAANHVCNLLISLAHYAEPYTGD